MKIAAAPISWGVSEVAEWGHVMAPARVLREMRHLGLAATELGPPGYLPGNPRELRQLLARSGLQLAAGFIAAVLHDSGKTAESLAAIEQQASTLAAGGADSLILAAALPGGGYDRRHRLGRDAMATLAETLAAAGELATRHGLSLAVHPHFGTALELEEEVIWLLTMTDVDLCLDTGHLYLGGADSAKLARGYANRIGHVHLKDVDARVARQVRSGEMSYSAGIHAGLYRPLGRGDLDIASVWCELQQAGYQGWYVLEQDVALTAEPGTSDGPSIMVQQSLDYISSLTSATQSRIHSDHMGR